MRAVALIAGIVCSIAAAAEAPPAVVADRIVIEKAAHRMTLLSGGAKIKTYKITLGSHPVGPKRRQGDGRTPEGLYVIDQRKADSYFHRALHISYPNADDAARAVALGVDPGGDIMIHGIGYEREWLSPARRAKDWTKGCIAVSDAEIDEIWDEVPVGTVVEIRP